MRAVAKPSAFGILPPKRLDPLLNRGVYGLDLSKVLSVGRFYSHR
jgi:hypothetical protein